MYKYIQLKKNHCSGSNQMSVPSKVYRRKETYLTDSSR